MYIFACQFQALVRESIAYSYMDFQKSTDGHPWCFDFSLQLFIQAWIFTLTLKQGYPCNDILQWIWANKIFVNGYSFFMDQSSIIHAFMDSHWDILGFLWIYEHPKESRSRGMFAANVSVNIWWGGEIFHVGLRDEGKITLPGRPYLCDQSREIPSHYVRGHPEAHETS